MSTRKLVATTAIALIASLLLVAPPADLSADDAPASWRYVADPEKTEIKVYAYKGGLLSGLAHDHEIAARRYEAKLAYVADAAEKSTVEVSIDVAGLEVVDPGVDEDDKAEIDETLKGEDVLDAARFPTISFRSKKVEVRSREGAALDLRVVGDFSLHGNQREVEVFVRFEAADAESCRATGELRVLTSDYGMEPYSAALGTISVKDEVRITFTIVGKRALEGG